MSSVDRLRQSIYANNATVAQQGRGSSFLDPEIGKTLRSFSKDEERAYLKNREFVLDAETEVLKAQVDLAKAILKNKQALEALDQKDAASYNANIAKIKQELIKARKDLAVKRSAWNARAVNGAMRAGTKAGLAGNDAASAAWQSFTDSLVGQAGTTVLDPELPKTLREIEDRFPGGVRFDQDFNPTFGSVQDKATQDFILDLAKRAKGVQFGLTRGEAGLNNLEKYLDDIFVAPDSIWGGTDEERRAHYKQVSDNYTKLFEKIAGADPYEQTIANFENKQDEAFSTKELSGRVDTLYDLYLGKNGTASAKDRNNMAHALYLLEQSGWRDDNRPNDNRGRYFDRDGDGIMDDAIFTPDDMKALLEWDNQKNRGAGRYGLKKGTTGALVRFEVKATPQQLAKMRNKDGQYSYVLDPDGKKVYLTPEQAAAVIASAPQPVQARIVSIKGPDKTADGMKLPNGKIFVVQEGTWVEIPQSFFETEEGRGFSVEEKGWIPSEQTKAMMQEGERPKWQDLKKLVTESPESPASSVQLTQEDPPLTFTREGEKMKIHATDEMKYPKGSIRLRGGETIPADQVVGPVQMFASLTKDFGLTGPQGSYAKWKGLQAQGKVREFVGRGLLDRSPIESRRIGALQFDIYGVDAGEEIRKLFGKKPGEEPVEDLPEELVDPTAESEEDMDKAAGLADDAPKDETREERRSRRDEIKEQLRRGKDRGELPEEALEELPEGEDAPRADMLTEPRVDPDEISVEDLALTEQRVPEETMASLATDAMAKKKRQEEELAVPPAADLSIAFDAGSAEGEQRKKELAEGREADRLYEKQLDEDVDYQKALADWRAAGADPQKEPPKPPREISFFSGKRAEKEEAPEPEETAEAPKKVPGVRRRLLNLGDTSVEEIRDIMSKGAIFTGMETQSVPPKYSYLMPGDVGYEELKNRPEPIEIPSPRRELVLPPTKGPPIGPSYVPPVYRGTPGPPLSVDAVYRRPAIPEEVQKLFDEYPNIPFSPEDFVRKGRPEIVAQQLGLTTGDLTEPLPRGIREPFRYSDLTAPLPRGIREPFRYSDLNKPLSGVPAYESSEGLTALRAFGDRLDKGNTLADRMQARRKKKQKSPTEEMSPGNEGVPGGAGTDEDPLQGSKVKEEGQ